MPLAALGESVPRLVAETGLFAKIILLILFVISVISWAIIWDRTRFYIKLRNRGAQARKILSTRGLQGALAALGECLPSPEGVLLRETAEFLGRGQGGENPSSLRSVLERRAVEEVSEMEKYLVFLATTASASPFLGLLGTVWGIMSSFLSMGIHGTASIEVVGPGIAEALVTTIAGLGAAIPALVGYNLLVRHIHRQEVKLDLFIARIVEEAEPRAEVEAKPRREVSYEENSL